MSKRAASNAEWERWGKTDPLFAVASWKGKQRGGPNPWTDEEFYDLGQSDWEDFQRLWERYGVDSESCVEIGCGAGRITMHLANFFRSVHAIDVSKDMLDYASRRIQSPRVSFCHSNGTAIPLDDAIATAAFSTHVFQHFDSLPIALDNFAEIARVLKPAGTMMIHLPLYGWPGMPKLFESIYQFRRKLGDARAGLKRSLMSLGLAEPIMRGTAYPMDFFFQELPKLGFVAVELAVVTTKANGSPHPFVLARKAPALGGSKSAG